MNKQSQRLFSLFFAVLFSVVFVSAQENRAVPKVINGGVVNSKATQLVKPAYPAAAKAVNASGAVNVQITIDENGDVSEAAAMSGHPLLRSAAVDAARASKFAPTLLSGQPVKVTGVVVYNFVAGMNLEQIGFALGEAAASSRFSDNYRLAQIESALPSDWTDSKAIAESLGNKQNWERKQQIKARIAAAQQNPEELRKATGIQGVAVIGSQKEPVDVKESYDALVDSLTESIKNHLSADESKKWFFMLGQQFGKIHAQIEDENKLRQNLAELRQFAATAPTSISSSDLFAGVQKLATLADDGELDAADKARIESFAGRFR
jgi:TonB family protein